MNSAGPGRREVSCASAGREERRWGALLGSVDSRDYDDASKASGREPRNGKAPGDVDMARPSNQERRSRMSSPLAAESYLFVRASASRGGMRLLRLRPEWKCEAPPRAWKGSPAASCAII